jgi:hypothetical protein
VTRTRPKGRQKVAPLNFVMSVVVALLFGGVSSFGPNVIRNVRKGEEVFLYDIVQFPGAVNNTMNFNGFGTNHVEYEVGVDDKDSIT